MRRARDKWRRATSSYLRTKPLSHPQRQRDQAERADDDAPPGEQRKAVPRDVAEQRLDHEPAADERHRKADGDEQRVAAGGEFVTVLEGFEREGADHGR